METRSAETNKWNDKNLIFYDTFPLGHNAIAETKTYVPKKTRISDKSVLMVMRHYFTNYHTLLRGRRWEYSFLKKRVNDLIMKKLCETGYARRDINENY